MVVPSDECIGSSYAFSGNIQRGIRAKKALVHPMLKNCSKAQDYFRIL
jgi:hypothetical protein